MSYPRPPIRIELRARRAWVTLCILAVNVALYFYGLSLGEAGEDWIVTRFGQDRSAVWAGEYWRLITAVFLHASAAHLTLNMFAHFYLGRLMERLLGHWRFLLLYTVSALGGAVLFQVTSDATLGLGASGAVYGVFGAFLVLKSVLRRDGRLSPFWSFAFWALFVMALDRAFALVVEAGSGVGIASSAHLGGFISGTVLGFTWVPLFVRVSPVQRRLRIAAHAGLVCAFAGLALYGQLHARHEEAWDALSVGRRIAQLLSEKDFPGAVAAWERSPRGEGTAREDGEYREIGYQLYDELMAAGQRDLATGVIDELLGLGAAALKAAERQGTATPDLLNEVAWYCALRGKELQTARQYADIAVRAAGSRPRRWPMRWFLPRVADTKKLSMYLNTRGWIEFQLGEQASALKDLLEAARIYPAGANYLYLALAHFGLNHMREAREAAERAREEGGLTPYERRLLEELEGDLGGYSGSGSMDR